MSITGRARDKLGKTHVVVARAVNVAVAHGERMSGGRLCVARLEHSETKTRQLCTAAERDLARERERLGDGVFGC